jgi:hypothetical protein
MTSLSASTDLRLKKKITITKQHNAAGTWCTSHILFKLSGFVSCNGPEGLGLELEQKCKPTTSRWFPAF